ncbi:hypothetical protein XENOCAPTIV_028936 [Xenoophorus captivus]|uniref:Uncharacterized protein n=1 Tax=Xenoophorus captivus TaxID=1517983 RepID=A0ABV0RG04_9TELE
MTGPLLEFETEMFLSLFESDGLLVAAEGLGIDRILLQFMRVYSEEGSLVLLLNTTTAEQVRTTVTSDVQSAERYKVYTEGGVLFVTSRILVVDFLTDRIPAHLISGQKPKYRHLVEVVDPVTHPCIFSISIHVLTLVFNQQIPSVCEHSAGQAQARGGRVLICASDDRTCAQLQQFIKHGSDWLLNQLYARTIGKRDPAAAAAAFELEPHKKGKGWMKKGGKGKEPAQKRSTKTSKNKSRPSLTLTQMMGKEESDETGVMGSSEDEDNLMDGDEGKEEQLNLNVSSDAYYGVLKEPLTVIHPLKGCTDPHSLTRVLHEVEPSFVVLYDAELSFVRQLEIYKANRPGKPLRVYFLIYGGSTEEQKYLTALSKEKKAFEHLIRSESSFWILKQLLFLLNV